MSAEQGMSFLDHLEELRWRLLKTLLAVVAGGALSFLFLDEILAFLLQPIHSAGATVQLQVIKVAGMFFVQWNLTLIGGTAVAFPVVIYQAWQFIAPGLMQKEKRMAGPLLVGSTAAFFAGVAFAWTVIIPYSMKFFISLTFPGIINQFAIESYLGYVFWVCVASGLIFQIPVIVVVLTWVGLVTPAFLRHYRRHSLMVIVIASGIITPPDPISFILMALPLAALYELSIWLSALLGRRK